jgi:hypothetical protein
MILAATGGRNFEDRSAVDRALDVIHDRTPIRLLVHGACPTGVDEFARAWAVRRGVEHTGQTYRANWRKHGKAAGPIRNRAMLATEHPDVLLAFQGGSGTADCVRAALALGIRVISMPDEAERLPLSARRR